MVGSFVQDVVKYQLSKKDMTLNAPILTCKFVQSPTVQSPTVTFNRKTVRIHERFMITKLRSRLIRSCVR